MRLAAISILILLLLSLSFALCEDSPACRAQEQSSAAQEPRFPEQENHCCQADPAGGAQDDRCPPSCHCSCCHSPAVFPLVKQTFPPFAPEAAKPALAFGYYQSDFHHYIWHPPQPA